MPLKNVAQLRALKAKERRGEISSEKVREFIDATPRTKSGHLDIPRGPKRVRKADDKRSDLSYATQLGGGAAIGTAAFSNRVPEWAKAGQARVAQARIKRFQSGRGRTGYLVNGRAADPASLSRKKPPVRVDSQGRPQGRPQSPRTQARRAWQSRNEALTGSLRRAKKPPKLGTRMGAIIGGGTVGGLMAWDAARGLAKPDKVGKSMTQTDVDRAAAGAAATGGLYHLGPSYGVEPAMRRRWRKKIQADPSLRAVDQMHGKKTGALGANGRRGMTVGEKGWIKHNRTLPKQLPGARVRRTMAYTHAGKTGMAATAGLMALGGAAAVAAGRRHDRKQPVGKAFGRLHRIRLPQQSRTQASTVTTASQESYDRRKKRRGTITKASPVVRAEMYPNLRPIPDNGYIRLVRTPTDVTRQIASTRMMDRARAEERRPRRRGRLSPTTRYTMGRQYLFATTAEDRR